MLDQARALPPLPTFAAYCTFDSARPLFDARWPAKMRVEEENLMPVASVALKTSRAARIRRADGDADHPAARPTRRASRRCWRAAAQRASTPSSSMATASMRPTSPISPATIRASRKRCWSSCPAASRSFWSAMKAGAMPRSVAGPYERVLYQTFCLPGQPRDRSPSLTAHPCRLRPEVRPDDRRDRLEAVRAGRPRLRRDGARPAVLHRRHAARAWPASAARSSTPPT